MSMRICFTLDSNLDAILIEKIKARAGKISKRHQAAKQMLQELSHTEDVLKIPNQYQTSTKPVPSHDNSGELDLSNLNDVLDNL